MDPNHSAVRKPSRAGRDAGALSTLPNRANFPLSWKQEVNERIAAHKMRRGSWPAEPEGMPEARPGAGNRAAAAARVAARYANAPSYSEILAGDARVAVRAAEAASRAAHQAQVAAEAVLAGLEAASDAELDWERHRSTGEDEEQEADRAPESRSTPGSAGDWFTPSACDDSRSAETDWMARSAEVEVLYETDGDDRFEGYMGRKARRARRSEEAASEDAIEVAQPAEPLHANLIEFPRELVATRKARPRRAEGPYAAAAEAGSQLSIFEVDPGTISVEPEEGQATSETAAPGRTGPEWSGIELGAQPKPGFAEESAEQAVQQAPGPLSADRDAALAPMSLRAMAAVVNLALIVGAFLVAAFVAASNVNVLPPLRVMEVGSVFGLLVVGALYEALFYVLAKGTPGMYYAGISLSTFGGRSPNRARRCARLVAMLVSVLPMGLGVMWAIFDEDRLSWHDRLSQTYLRRG